MMSYFSAMPMAFSGVKRTGWRSRATWGLVSRRRAAADSSFGSPDGGVAVEKLALEVGEIDGIGIDQAEAADARRGEVEGGGRAQAAGADEEDGGVLQAELSGLANSRDEDVAGVAGFFFRAEHRGRITSRFQTSNFNEEAMFH